MKNSSNVTESAAVVRLLQWPCTTFPAVTVAITVILLFACTEAPTWPKLLARKISEQYPGYTVKITDDGNLMVERPGLPAVPVDAQAIGRFCQRGPQDCNYATDLMLLELQPK